MAMTLITTNTESNAASSSFTSSIDSTYKLYIFKFHDVNPATDDTDFHFQANAAGASGYNETITSTWFRAYHQEDDGGTPNVAYHTGSDQAQGTAFQKITNNGNGADESIAGELFLFNPSNATYVKHFYATSIANAEPDAAYNNYTAGYFNTTDNIDAINFSMTSGDFDAVIKMYGVG